MKITLVDNSSKLRGGANNVILNTRKVLEKKGHNVDLFWGDKELPNQNRRKKPLQFLYYFTAKKKFRTYLNEFNPEIIHLNNIYHYLSPSIIDAAKEKEIPVVMTLHDYKLVCAVYKLWRNGAVCEQCKGKKYFNILKNGCNLKGNKLESILLWLEMNLHHRILHIYNKVDLFISPSRFLKDKFYELGFKGEIRQITNFVFPNNYNPVYSAEEKRIVYFGRIVEHKGLKYLVDAVKNLPIQLRIIGAGSYRQELMQKIKEEQINNIKFTGWMEKESLKKEIQASIFTVLPAVWYENCPLSVLESFALGKPVIGSDIGGIPELVKSKETGLLVPPKQTTQLKKKISWLVGHQQERRQMGRNARRLVEKYYNEKHYYQQLIKIYQQVL